MPAAAPSSAHNLGSVLVVGGCGFLGHHIVKQLSSSKTHRCTSLAVLDLHTDRNRLPAAAKVQYHNGDITSADSLAPIFESVRPDVVIHTASPVLMELDKEIMYKVNVEGTRALLDVAAKTGVKAFVYTSSASVVSDNVTDLVNADERWPIVPKHLQTEYYSWTKAEAEALVLAANRATAAPNLLTTSLRPAGVLGEGDTQLLPPMMAVYRAGRTGVQLGANENLFDFTYVGNVAHAHILAASALVRTAEKTTGAAGSIDKVLDHERVDGEIFFITNDSPVYFWDFPRMVWRTAAVLESPSSPNLPVAYPWILPPDLALFLASLLEYLLWPLGRKPPLARKQVRYSCMTRYYSCDKAKMRLGYRPIVGLEEGVRRGVEWILEQEKEKAAREGVKKTQ
ncbi:MAG: erg26, C-3 sterol dehydrogenase [Caeruleum heppii]|nr:MAG: erg26, C-3 sterol dehydrogenase [Caeruleum heppii]